MVAISGGDKLRAKLAELSRKLERGGEVKVGFLSNATYSSGKKVALIAALNEFGHRIGAAPGEGVEDTRQRVPPRPFFRNMVAAKSAEWPEAIKQNLVATNYDVDVTLARVGEGIAGQLRQSIVDTNDPPLAASTIARKGFDKPLVDTGVMLQSVDYEVVDSPTRALTPEAEAARNVGTAKQIAGIRGS